MDDQLPLPGMDPPTGASAPKAIDTALPPRLRRADRAQAVMLPCSLDELLADDHTARMVWKTVCSLDLSQFEDTVAARGSEPGRAATDPRILIALLLYAAVEGVGSGREIDRLCGCHDAYRWIVGGVSLNYHTLNDFRVGHEKALDQLLAQIIAILVKKELIDVTRLTQDGIRVRASAGSNTFRSESTLEKLQEEAKAHLESLKTQDDPALSAQQQAKRMADAKDKAARLDEALKQLPALRESQEESCKRSGRKKHETRVSTTDPDCRVMKMPDGGFRPAYNVQLAADTQGRAIVGVEVTNSGSDSGLDAPMREQVEERSGGQVKEHLLDGGYTSLEAIDKAETNDVKIYAPVDKPNKPDADPFVRKAKDTDKTFEWRERMATDAGKAIYKLRGSTIETINADLAQHRNMRQFPVRGSPKVRCFALWMALVYNILRFGTELIAAACEIC